MRPFKMFFGMAIAIMFFLFVARVVVFAFIAAAFMSIIYAVYRRLKDFITYDRFGEYYLKGYDSNPRLNPNWNNQIEPLFHGSTRKYKTRNTNVRFIDAN